MFNSTYDEPTREEIQEAIQNARDRLHLWKKRTVSSGLALFLGCATVYPFLYGHPFHRYWDALGKYAVLASMGLLVVFVYCRATLWAAWICPRDLRKEQAQRQTAAVAQHPRREAE